MRTVRLTRPRLAFVVATRAALAAGIGLLVSSRLPLPARRVVGLGLLALGAVTTIPAVRMVVSAT